ncbi:hypothetical protein MNBD_DELTA04-1161 [hydrothermal vent metagenome]|uniref:Thioredoxin domain-containing protein n=1 Tax=hydrothermal vent metagenome TaxID=652676 RepID=A0A3B0W9I2_9ZZZZ
MGHINKRGKLDFKITFSIIVFFVSFVSFSCITNAQALLQTGMAAPQFSLKNIENDKISLSQYSRKKAVIILFWATWSANSPRALKRFERFYKKYKDKGIQVIGINVENQTISDNDVGNIKEVIKKLQITFPVLLDRGLKTFHSYHVMALPSTIVVSGGKISYELPALPIIGTENMFNYLLALIGESPPRKVIPIHMPRYDVIADTNLGRRFAKRKIYVMASSLFEKAIKKDPEYIVPYIALAELYGSEGKNTEAEKTLRKALAVEPGNVVTMSELGYLLSKTGKIKEAIKILSGAVKKNSYTPAYYYLAYALSKDGKLKEALKLFKKAISLNPYEPAIYLLRAEVYENSKMLKEAASDYRKALELFLGDPLLIQ